MNLQQLYRSNDHGFSFIEMACAIIILGITFAMAMKGAIVVDFFRAFITRTQFEQYQNNLLVYSATYNSLPGDDVGAPHRYGRDPAIMIVDGRAIVQTGNGVIDGRLSDIENVNGEHIMAWRDLRYAKLIDGNPDDIGFAALPSNLFGGYFGFDGGNMGQGSGSICATRIPGEAAEQIDAWLDDGLIKSGKVVATAKFSMEAYNHFDKPDSEAYSIEKEYIICLQLEP